MVNQKEHVQGLFDSVMKKEDKLSRLETDGNYFAYYDNENDYERRYYYDDTQESVKARIMMDSEVEAFLPRDRFAGFLMLAGFYMGQAGPDTFMVMERLVFIWEDEEGRSMSRDALEKEFGDGYAQCIAEGFLGQTWVDRQIPVINVPGILESCRELHEEELDPPFERFFLEAMLQTLFHEFRHLLYECNDAISIGDGTPYPLDGGVEGEVEEYGNTMAEKLLDEFINIVDREVLGGILSERKGENA